MLTEWQSIPKNKEEAGYMDSNAGTEEGSSRGSSHGFTENCREAVQEFGAGKQSKKLEKNK